MELLIRSLKDCLKSSRWEEARYLVRFVSDLVNCHVISAGSLLQLLDNFVDAALEEGVPQVSSLWDLIIEQLYFQGSNNKTGDVGKNRTLPNS